MLSITHCCKSLWLERWRPCLLSLALACCLALGLLAGAQAQSTRLEQLQVEPGEQALLLSARVDLHLPAEVHDALLKGIPVYFVAEADVFRARWYWSDRRVASARRYMRLAYQTLTGRWRLNVSAEPLNHVSLGLSQYYDSLDDALAAAGRIVGWQIDMPAGKAASSAVQQTLRFRYRLDIGQLPRTLQMAEAGRQNWVLDIERRIDLTHQPTPVQASEPGKAPEKAQETAPEKTPEKTPEKAQEPSSEPTPPESQP